MVAAKCAKGHTLLGQTPVGAGRSRITKKMQCDRCKAIAKVTQFVGCRPCDYDVCLACFKKMAESDPPVHDMKELLGDSFLSKDKTKKSFDEAVKGRTVAVYFWSHKCDICTSFSKALAAFHAELTAQGSMLQILAVTDTGDDADDEAKDMQTAFETTHGEWLTVPFDDESTRHKLHDWAAELLGDSPSGSGPILTVVDSRGVVLSSRAMLQIASGVDYIRTESWVPPAVGNLSSGPYADGGDVAMRKVLVVLAEKCSKSVVAKLNTTLKAVRDALLSRVDPPIVLIGLQTGPAKGVRKDVYEALSLGCPTYGRGWTPRAIRAWCSAAERLKTPDPRPVMLMMNVSEFVDSAEHGFYLSDATLITEKKVLDFIDGIEAGEGQLQPFAFANYAESFEAPEARPHRDGPLHGTVNADGCYVGGTWDDFGVEGITGAIQCGITGDDDDDDGESAESSEYEDEAAAVNKHGQAAQQYIKGGIAAFVEDLASLECEGDQPKKPVKPLRPPNRAIPPTTTTPAPAATTPPAPVPLEANPSSVAVKPRTNTELCATVSALEATVALQKQAIEGLLDRVAGLERRAAKKGAKPAKNVTFSPADEQQEGDGSGGVLHSSPMFAGKQKAASSSSRGEGEAPEAPAALPPAPKDAYKCEDDNETDSNDSDVMAYRAQQKAKVLDTGAEDSKHGPSAVAGGAAAAFKSEDDDSTDSDDSDVAAYRASQKEKAGGAAEGVAAAAAAKDGDWTCAHCKGFNWASAERCAHCGWEC